MVDEMQSESPEPAVSNPAAPAPNLEPTLRRLPEEGWIAGVCAGIGDMLGVPAWTIRTATILLSFTGFGIVAYLLAALLMRDPNGTRLIDRRGAKELLLYAATAIVGWITLPDMFFGSSLNDRAGVFRAMIPWLLLVAGLALLLRTDATAKGAHTEGAAAAPAAVPQSQEAARIGGVRAMTWARGHFPVLGPIALLVTLAGAAIAIGLGAPVGIVAGFSVIALGTAMMFGSKVGKARGLVIPAAAVSVLAAPALLGGLHVRTMNAPDSMSASATLAPSSLRAAFGVTTIDLLALRSTGTIERTYEIGSGNMNVVLPAHMKTIVDADVSRLGSGITVLQPSARYATWMVNAEQRQSTLENIRDIRVLDPTMLATLQHQGEATGQYFGEHASAFEVLPLTTIDPRPSRHLRKTFEGAQRAPVVPSKTVESEPAVGTLRLHLRIGTGLLSILDPVWTELPEVAPGKALYQACAQAGGAIGKIKPCSELPRAERIPTCLIQPVPQASESMGTIFEAAKGVSPDEVMISATSSVADCRALAAERDDETRIVLLACTSGGTYVGCSAVGIKNDTDVAVQETPVGPMENGELGVSQTIPPIGAAPTTSVAPPENTGPTVPPIAAATTLPPQTATTAPTSAGTTAPTTPTTTTTTTKEAN